MSTIYLDNAATTKVRKEVADSISLVIQNEYGNPSSNTVRWSRGFRMTPFRGRKAGRGPRGT
jgi:cysteine sulfinate desulfinase/cysteine desulfurase-like protein